MALGANAEVFRKIWRLRVPEKIRYFIWLCINDSVLNNWERKRRHIAMDALCVCCNREEETYEHLFRDCQHVSVTWIDLIDSNQDVFLFFQIPFSSWIRSNLLETRVWSENLDWSSLFSTTLWWTWRWRNQKTFCNESTNVHRQSFIIKRCKEYDEAMKNQVSTKNLNKSFTDISWKCPT